MNNKNPEKALALSVLLLGSVLVAGEDCRRRSEPIFTNAFSFSASSDQGAVGDVVGVDLSLSMDVIHPWLTGIAVAGCFDSSAASLLDQVAYTPLFDELAPFSFFFAVDPGGVGAQRPGGGGGFVLGANLWDERTWTPISPIRRCRRP